jgi:hypothetical protein
MKKIGAEFILGFVALPWIAWATVSIFSSQSASAVQESKLDQIKVMLEEIRLDVKAIKEK